MSCSSLKLASIAGQYKVEGQQGDAPRTGSAVLVKTIPTLLLRDARQVRLIPVLAVYAETTASTVSDGRAVERRAPEIARA